MSSDVDVEDDARLVAVDPTDLEPGDDVVIQDAGGGLETRGTVEDVEIVAGRAGVTISREDARDVAAWEQTGRTYTRVEEGE